MCIVNLCVTVGVKVGDTSDKDSSQPRKVSVTRIKDLPILTPDILELSIFSFQCPALSRHKRNLRDTPDVKTVLLRF